MTFPMRQWSARRRSGIVFRTALFVLALCALLPMVAMVAMAGCANGSTSASPAYGGSLNHLHDLLPLHGIAGTVLLATHLGLYRTTDRGQTWRQVAGGPGQAMDGLMIFKLAQSPLDPKRIYALATLRSSVPPPAAPGLYRSADAGQTWQLATPFTSSSTRSVYTIAVGAGTASDVYAFLPALATHGLSASDDAGAHWKAQPPLPTSDVTGVADDPAHPDHLLIWSPASGLYQSTDHGGSWNPVSSVQGGVYGLTFADKLIYVQSDSGLFASDTTGTLFHLVNPTVNFSSIEFCAVAPTEGYGLTGTGVERTLDGGKSWRATAPLSGHPSQVAVDPEDANIAYVGFSYPLGLDLTTDGGRHWQSVLTAS